MPTLYEARCLNCGDLGHYKDHCPRTECRKCHSLGHTGSVCHVKLPSVKVDNKTVGDETPTKDKALLREHSSCGEDHLEKYYAS